eukprot:TRINITY_DN893_c0_g1_i2.p1 TRINITY_DN893_c0_g1~~TRINITY_DN893_c0_g1_i2.p1  ORF type:complete len:350 (-),score=41.19 TRINITY_DN893_c0_g1_i2:544-1593(-)
MARFEFERIFGFKEADGGTTEYAQARDYVNNQENLLSRFDANSMTLNGHHVGDFRVHSTAELRVMVKTVLRSDGASSRGNVRVSNIRGNALTLHHDKSFQHATFQAASQFNCLEFRDEGCIPELGITRYGEDRTQGPVCATACPAGTAFRNYLVPMGDGFIGQTRRRQIDASDALHRYLVNVARAKRNAAPLASSAPIPPDETLWFVLNGYLDATDAQLTRVGHVLAGLTIEERSEAVARTQVGVQWDTEVDGPRSNHTVSQVYASAIAISYSKLRASHEVSEERWRPLAQLVLVGAYEATLLAGLVQNLRHQTTNTNTFRRHSSEEDMPLRRGEGAKARRGGRGKARR